MDEKMQQIIEDSEKIRNRNRDLESELHGLKVENERLKEENEVLFVTQGGADHQNLRDALKWLHDQGGIGAVYSRYKDIVLGEAEEALKVVYSEDIEKRLMPEGMEWPRFEDGEPVHVGDEVDFGSACGAVSSIEFQNCGYFIVHICDGAGDHYHSQYFPGESIKSHAPKTLDKDGIETRVGDTVWNASGTEFEVMALSGDGKTVHVKWGNGRDAKTGTCAAKSLTHERPDSWERLEEDAENVQNYADIRAYVVKRNLMHINYETGDSLHLIVARDLVCRAKALAERGQ